MSASSRSVYSDLNVHCTESEAANLRLLQALANSGYERVALCRHVMIVKGVQLKPAPSLEAMQTQTPPTKTGKRLEVLQRLAVSVEDPSLLHILSSPAVDGYDMLSVCPGSERVFQQLCGVLPVDIISLNLTERLPFPLKRTQLSQAVERGVFFEICYSPAIRGSSGRKYTIANAQELVKGTRGKNILISSGAEKVLELRPPLDVANLGHLFGLNHTQCKAALTTVSRAVLLHAHMRRHCAKAVVSSEPLLPVARRKRARVEEEEGREEEGEAEGGDGCVQTSKRQDREL